MRKFFVLVLMILTACSPEVTSPSPTADDPTPTFESPAATPDEETSTGEANLEMQFSGAISGEFTEALLSFQVGENYTLLFDNIDDTNPVQLRLLLVGNIEPGTHEIVAAEDFQLPTDASVAAHFDLGFPATTYTGSLALDSIGEDNFSGTLELTATAGGDTVAVSGRFENLSLVIID